MIKNIIILSAITLTTILHLQQIEINHTRDVLYTESLNTLEDICFWIEEDIKSGKVDAEVGITYLANIEGTIIDLKQ